MIKFRSTITKYRLPIVLIFIINYGSLINDDQIFIIDYQISMTDCVNFNYGLFNFDYWWSNFNFYNRVSNLDYQWSNFDFHYQICVNSDYRLSKNHWLSDLDYCVNFDYGLCNFDYQLYKF